MKIQNIKTGEIVDILEFYKNNFDDKTKQKVVNSITEYIKEVKNE